MNCTLRNLNPVLENNLLVVGGCLKYSHLTSVEKNPVILPKGCHIALLLTSSPCAGETPRSSLDKRCDQGRKSVDFRRQATYQFNTSQVCNLADLPPEHRKICPPFTHVGLDVFGPWSVTTRCTRGGQAESK